MAEFSPSFAEQFHTHIVLLAPTLVQWRLQMFYQQFFHSAASKSNVADHLAAFQPLFSNHNWAAISATLDTEQATAKHRITSVMYALLLSSHSARLRGLPFLKAVHAISASTSLPLRQIVAAVRAYAHFSTVSKTRVGQQQASPRWRHQPDPRLLDARYFADRKMFSELAEMILDDEEDFKRCMTLFCTNESKELASSSSQIPSYTSLAEAIASCKHHFFQLLSRESHSWHSGWCGGRNARIKISYGLSWREEQMLEGDIDVMGEMRAQGQMNMLLTDATRERTKERVQTGVQLMRKSRGGGRAKEATTFGAVREEDVDDAAEERSG